MSNKNKSGKKDNEYSPNIPIISDDIRETMKFIPPEGLLDISFGIQDGKAILAIMNEGPSLNVEVFNTANNNESVFSSSDGQIDCVKITLSTPNEVSDLIISLITLGELICNQEEYKKVYDFYTEWVKIYNNGEKK